MTVMTAPTTSEIGSLNYEESLEELDRLIGSLEAGNVPLAEALALYERGTKLAQRCAELLEKTEAQVTELMVKGNGAVAEKPLLVEADAQPKRETPPRAPAGTPPIDPDEIPF
jgi:exodeoxyribonuclease VII small subunit